MACITINGATKNQKTASDEGIHLSEKLDSAKTKSSISNETNDENTVTKIAQNVGNFGF